LETYTSELLEQAAKDQKVVKSSAGSGPRKELPEKSRMKDNQKHSKKGLRAECKPEGQSLVVLQVNCRSIYNKALELWKLVDTYNPDIIIGTESWLREEIGNTEIFRTDFTTFRRDRHTPGGDVFICVKNNITFSELWVDDEFKISAVEVKGSDPKIAWEIVSIYRVPNNDIRAVEKLAAQTELVGNFRKRSIIGGNLNSFVPHKVLKQNPDPEYYNKEVKRLKAKVRRAYNKKKLGKHYQEELKRLAKKSLTVKRRAQETFLSSVL
jgi:hypothetical protein